MPIVLFSFFVLMMALSFLTSFISIRFDIAHLSKEWIGVVGSMYTMGMTLSNFGFSRFVARYGFIRTYVGISSVIGLSMLLLGFVFNPWVWSVLRFVIGYGLGAIFIIIESWVMKHNFREKHIDNGIHNSTCKTLDKIHRRFL